MSISAFSAELWAEEESWSRDKIESFQMQALQSQLQRVYDRSDYYGRMFRDCGFNPADFKSFDDLRKLPLTRKQDYVAALAGARPYGPFLAVPPEDVVRVHFSSGTTGQPTPMFWTAHDLDRWADIYARFFYAQGLRRNDVLQVLFSYPWFVGGLGATAGATRIGAMVIPGGSVDSKRQIETIFDYGTTAVVGTPSFLAHLAEVAASMELDLRQSKVRHAGVGGEPGASIPGTRKRISDLWDMQVLDCYGLLEFQPVAWEGAAQAGMVLAEDFVFAEVLEPDTLEPVPDGKPGVLVLTHLDKCACPLVRWWTGDMVVRDRRIGPDGRTHGRLVGGIQGRADDMLVIRGVNLFPSAVEAQIGLMDEASGEYQIILDDTVRDAETGFLTGIRVRMEVNGEPSRALGDRLAARLREKLQVQVHVEPVPVGSLARSTHKAQRVVRM